MYIIAKCCQYGVHVAILWLSKNAGSDSLSTGAVATITFTVTFIITLTATAIVTFIVTYICVKRKFDSAINHNNQSPQEKVIII